jgi:hypothetical protein
VTPTATATLTPWPELIVDNVDPGFSTTSVQDAWTEWVKADAGNWGDSHHFNRDAGSGQDVATWAFTVPTPGRYKVYAWWLAREWRPTDVPYTIHHLEGSSIVRVNQQRDGGRWNQLGQYRFTGSGSVQVSDDVSNGYGIIADAVRLVYVGP